MTQDKRAEQLDRSAENIKRDRLAAEKFLEDNAIIRHSLGTVQRDAKMEGDDSDFLREGLGLRLRHSDLSKQ
jgi:hypothetical protein